MGSKVVNGDLTLAFGASMITGEAFEKDDVVGGNPNSKIGLGMHNDTNLSGLRAGTMYGGAIYKGQASFYGHNSEKRLHSVQNKVHRSWPIKTTEYFPDRGLPSKPYTYSGSYHLSYLYY